MLLICKGRFREDKKKKTQRLVSQKIIDIYSINNYFNFYCNCQVEEITHKMSSPLLKDSDSKKNMQEFNFPTAFYHQSFSKQFYCSRKHLIGNRLTASEFTLEHIRTFRIDHQNQDAHSSTIISFSSLVQQRM